MQKKTLYIVLGVGGFTLLLLCCGGVSLGVAVLVYRSAADKDKRGKELAAIGKAYLQYYDDFHKGPVSPGELKPYLKDMPEAHQRLTDGSVVFHYGVGVVDMVNSGGTADTVLAYEKDTPTRGGWILRGDATVEYVTASQFASLRQAQAKGNEGK
jgi:hypothetical protein